MSQGKFLVRVLTDHGLTSSVSQARRLIAQGFILVNNQPELDLSRVLKPGNHLISVDGNYKQEINITIKEE